MGYVNNSHGFQFVENIRDLNHKLEDLFSKEYYWPNGSQHLINKTYLVNKQVKSIIWGYCDSIHTPENIILIRYEQI
jgi:hypothetical protein